MHAFSLQVLLADRFVTPIFTLWFIGLIMLCYFVYPFIVKFSRGSRVGIFLVSSVIFVFFVVLRVAFGMVDLRFFTYFPPFVTGMMLSRSGYEEGSSKLAFKIAVPVFVVALVAFALIDTPGSLSALRGITIPFSMVSWIVVLTMNVSSCVAILYLARSFVGRLSDKLTNVFFLMAVASYSVYLFHQPYFAFLYRVFNSTLLQNHAIIYDSLFWLNIPIVFILCYFLQKGYDIVCRSLTQKADSKCRLAV